MKIKQFKRICRLSQKDLKSTLAATLRETYAEVVSADGFLFARGAFPVLLVAHLDTVHRSLPTAIYFDRKSGALSAAEGIGGDDRAGVYIILELIKRFPCSVLFCEDEEVGGVGADAFARSPLAASVKPDFIVEFDRKGARDAVFYDCDTPEFTAFVTADFFREEWGSFSDISVIAPALGVAAVNLSCGYHSPHTLAETVHPAEVDAIIEAAAALLARHTEGTAYEYRERAYTPRGGSYWRDYFGGAWDSYGGGYGGGSTASARSWYCFTWRDKDGGEDFDFVDDAAGYYEALGLFLAAHPELTFADIIETESGGGATDTDTADTDTLHGDCDGCGAPRAEWRDGIGYLCAACYRRFYGG